ncbi:uncharacterized protein LOC144996348 [Oryzias latipes]
MCIYKYSRDILLQLRHTSNGCKHPIPPEIKKPFRGCRAGAKLKARRWRNKPFVPSIIMGNVNSLQNKCEELVALIRTDEAYRVSLYLLTESWLTDVIPDSAVSIPGYALVRADREVELCGKTKGGGLFVLVSNKWCHPGHITVKTCDVIQEVAARAQSAHPESLIIISGNFNHVDVSSHLGVFTQYVNCSTRHKNTLDLCYVNLRSAYTAVALPPLGRSDHNLIQLRPSYKPCVMRLHKATRSFRQWTPETAAMLRDCFESTDWDLLVGDSDSDIDQAVVCVTDYIHFCTDVAVPLKKVRCFPNNKPWIKSSMKHLLNLKKQAFKTGDRHKARVAQHDLRRAIRRARRDYKSGLEMKLQNKNTREVWSGMRTITGFKERGWTVPGDVAKADEFNHFYNRFDSVHAHPCPTISDSSTSAAVTVTGSPFPPSDRSLTSAALTGSSTPPSGGSYTSAAVTCSSPPPSSACSSSSPDAVTPIRIEEVCIELRRLNGWKSAGPNGISPRLLKDCASELAVPLQTIFNRSLQTGCVPGLWKTSCLVPVPKVTRPVGMKDYRPVALTSVIMGRPWCSGRAVVP